MDTSFASDPNEGVLHASERIHRLTKAVDVLVAREFIVQQKEAILEDLEAYISSIETEIASLDGDMKKVRDRCALLRPDRRCARSGENEGVTAMWMEHGESMQRLYTQHAMRLMKVEQLLKEVSDASVVAVVDEAKGRKTPISGDTCREVTTT